MASLVASRLASEDNQIAVIFGDNSVVGVHAGSTVIVVRVAGRTLGSTSVLVDATTSVIVVGLDVMCPRRLQLSIPAPTDRLTASAFLLSATHDALTYESQPAVVWLRLLSSMTPSDKSLPECLVLWWTVSVSHPTCKVP